MRFVRSAIVATVAIVWATSQAHAVTGALCISAKLNGPLKLRASGVCKEGKEIQIGSFDGATLQFSGINVQIVSGSGTTSGTVNGKGNLIVGYNESGLCTGVGGRTCSTNADCGADTCLPQSVGPTTGSHNLIVGALNGYGSYGGFVAGLRNTTSGSFASVSGGAGNTASGQFASVSGGGGNTANGQVSSISGGSGITQPATNGWAAGTRATSCGIVGTFEVCNFESP